MKFRIQVADRRVKVAFVFVVIAVLLVIRWILQSFAAEPEIALVYGEQWEEMRQRSSAVISPAIPNESWFRMRKSDARLRFIDPKYGFVTPLARFLQSDSPMGKFVISECHRR